MALRKARLAALAALCFGFGAAAETPSDIAILFGRADAVVGPQLSPDGRFLSMKCAPAVKPSVCVFDLTGGTEPVIVPTIEKARLANQYWASNDTLILDIDIFQTVKTDDGLKDYTFERAVSFNVLDKKPVMLLKHFAGGYLDANNLEAILPDEPGHILIGMFVERAAGIVFETLKVDLEKGTGKTVQSSTLKAYGAVHRPNGERVVDLLYDRQPDDRHTLKVVAGKKTLLERRDLDFNPLSIWGIDISGNNLVIYLEEAERDGVFRLALSDGTLTPVDTEILGVDGNFTISPVIDPVTLQVVGFETYTDRFVQAFEDPQLRAQHEELSAAFPEAVVTLESWRADRAESVVKVETPGMPADYYLFTMASGELSPVGNSAPHLAGRALGQVEEVSYLAADGLEIPGYLTLPPGKTRADGPFKLILLPHGGPEARDIKTFDWWVQAYAAAGYAVLQPNFRGSTGFGNAFRDAGYGEFGGKMVQDVLDGARWAVAEGIATKGEVCAAGASYGGYSALMLGAIGGKEIRCVISVNGVTSPSMLLGDSQYQGFVYNYLVRYLGINRHSDAATREDISPMKLASKIAAPILLIAGKEDIVVPYTHAEGFKAAVRSRSDVELVPMEGEDHYLDSTISRHKVLDESLRFLGRHLPVE